MVSSSAEFSLSSNFDISRAEPGRQNGCKRSTLGEAYKSIGYGCYQRRLFFITGFCMMADSVQVAAVPYIEKEVPNTWSHVTGYQTQLLSIGFFLGELLGCLVWGPMADRAGRKKTYAICNICLLTFGVASAFAPSYTWLVILRTLVGICVSGFFVSYDNMAESLDETLLVRLTINIVYFWSVGTIYSNAVAALSLSNEYLSQYLGMASWRVYLLLCSIPDFLACIGYIFLDESPMWLLEKGCETEAMQILTKVACYNRKPMESINLVPYPRQDDPSILTSFSKEFRKRTIWLCAIWILSSVCYGGASFTTPFIFKSSGSVVEFKPVIFSSFGEILGVFASSVLVQRLNFMQTMIVFFSISTVANFSIMFHELMPMVALGTCVFFLRTAIAGAFTVLSTATPGAYPTFIRCTAHLLIVAFGRFGYIIPSILPTSWPVVVLLQIYAAGSLANALICISQNKYLSKVMSQIARDMAAGDMPRSPFRVSRQMALA